MLHFAAGSSPLNASKISIFPQNGRFFTPVGLEFQTEYLGFRVSFRHKRAKANFSSKLKIVYRCLKVHHSFLFINLSLVSFRLEFE